MIYQKTLNFKRSMFCLQVADELWYITSKKEERAAISFQQMSTG